MWLIPKNSLQLHIKKPWKSWAASILLALSSAGTQTARRCQRNPEFPSRPGNLSPVNPKTFSSPLVFKKEVKITHQFLQPVYGKWKRGLDWHRRGGRRNKICNNRLGFFPHNHITNLLKKRVMNTHDPPNKTLGYITEAGHQWHSSIKWIHPAATEKWHTNLPKTKFRYRKHK